MKSGEKLTISFMHSGRRLDQFLSSNIKGTSRKAIQEMIKSGDLKVNGEVLTKRDYALREGDVLEFKIPEDNSKALIGEKIPVEVVHEDRDLLVVLKPSGMVVHPGAGNKTGTLVHALIGSKRKLSDIGEEDRPGIVHRLDKETSGLLMVAKTNRAHSVLSQALAARTIEKEYLCVVEGRIEFDRGIIEKPLMRDKAQPVKRKVASPNGEGKDAVTEYEVLERWNFATYVIARPKTGRTHQIRVHLAHLGHPVLGDSLYSRHKPRHRLALHAHRLTFEHPVSGKLMKLVAEPPEDFMKIVETEKAR